MKSTLNYILVLALSVMVFSCKKDNYAPPGSTLSGKLTYKGETFGVERNQVPYELYQYGFGKVAALGQTFAQEGTYSQLLFDGDYKLIVPNGQGPFMWKKTASGTPDSLTVTMRGNQVLDLEVTPYYMFRSPNVTVASGKVSATFKLEKIITDAVNGKGIDNIVLYVNKTQFTSNDNNIVTTTIAGSAITDLNNISLSAAIPSMTPTQNYVFARLGLKISGIEDRIFSPLVKLTF